MATEIFTKEEVVLLDGTTVVLRPLPLKRLREFQGKWQAFSKFVRDNLDSGELTEEEFSDKQYEVFIELAVIALRFVHKSDLNDEDFKEWVEETVDEQTLYRVFERCGGLKLETPEEGNLEKSPMEEILGTA